MTFSTDYTQEAPSREQVDATQGSLLLEFGTDWCGFCRGAQHLIASALVKHPGVSHLKIEDGPGRPLGRSFRVKLWPTLIFLCNGKEIGRAVRPNDQKTIEDLLARIEPADTQTTF